MPYCEIWTRAELLGQIRESDEFAEEFHTHWSKFKLYEEDRRVAPVNDKYWLECVVA